MVMAAATTKTITNKVDMEEVFFLIFLKRIEVNEREGHIFIE